jgi:Mrp family chromosome partitioning ATPase
MSSSDCTSCFAGTREQLLTDIKAWIDEPSSKQPIYVLYGIAGIGKSTVAQTVAQYAASKKVLGASFFFSRSEEEWKTGVYFFSTLAFQLAFHDLQIGSHIASALLAIPDIPKKNLEDQMKYLILEPITKAQIHQQILIF